MWVVTPGAGGALGKSMRETLVPWLASRGVVLEPGPDEKLGPRAIGPALLAKFETRVVAACEAHPGARVVLVAQSYGSRVSAHFLAGTDAKHAEWKRQRPLPSNLAGFLSFGFPLAHKTQDRSQALANLPAHLQYCFVSGGSDAFLSNLPDLAQTHGLPLLLVDKGKHNVFDAPKPVQAAILEHLNDAFFPSTSRSSSSPA